MARKTTAPHGAAGGQPPATPIAQSGPAVPNAATGRPADVAPPAGHEGPRPGPLGRARRAAAGGRWWVWVGRAVLWAFIVVIAVNGGRAVYLSFTQGEAANPVAERGGDSQFPIRAAAGYAQEFATVYLNYDEATAATRAERLAGYLPDGADPQLGWNGAGRLRLDTVHLAAVEVRDDTHAVVKLAVLVNDRWMRLAVPVYVSGDAMVVAGQPALLPAPPKASLPPASGLSEVDADATRELERQLPGFFQAYAKSDSADLERYLDQGASVTGLSGTVRFASLRDVLVPPGDRTREITATVVWRIPSGGQNSPGRQQGSDVPAGELEQTYELTVTKQNDNWYVKDITGSTEQSGN